MELIEILQTQDIGTKIEHLKQRSSIIPSWPDIVKDYEPMLHTIVEDRKGRADKVHNDGTVDKAARIPIGLEKLLTKRVTEFTFAIPVKRVYTAEGETASHCQSHRSHLSGGTHRHGEHQARS